MTPPPGATVAPARPELVSAGYPVSRPRWIELVTSSDHKDIGRMFISGSLGFLLVATAEWLLMRLQLVIPENTMLRPEFYPHAVTAPVRFGSRPSAPSRRRGSR